MKNVQRNAGRSRSPTAEELGERPHKAGDPNSSISGPPLLGQFDCGLEVRRWQTCLLSLTFGCFALGAFSSGTVYADPPVADSALPEDVVTFASQWDETLYSYCASQSKAYRNVSIAIYVSRRARDRAVDHARKIRAALKGVGIESQIVVETHDKSGIGFSYYVNGFGAYDESLGKNGVYGFKNSIKVLPKVVAMFRAQIESAGDRQNSVEALTE